MTEAPNPGYGMKTLNIVRNLLDNGIKKMSILMRHSARHYDPDHMEREPLMWLTEEGKQFANDFGQHIPRMPLVRFYSSMLGRCIETAYQADKGYMSRGGVTESNIVTIELAPSFVKKPLEVFKLHHDLGTEQLFTEWFAGRLSDDLVGRSNVVADTMVSCLSGLLREGPESHIDIAVSHDWNLYMIKHHLLQLELAKTLAVEYLEGIVIYEENGSLFITNHETDALKINPDANP